MAPVGPNYKAWPTSVAADEGYPKGAACVATS